MSIYEESTRPPTSGSGATLTFQADPQDTGRSGEKSALALEATLKGGEGESAIPEDKKQEALEELEEDWQHDPVNPRNWSQGKKYLNMSLVGLVHAQLPPNLTMYHRSRCIPLSLR